ncbi:S8 family serine peptidase [Clostridium nigeriense]|uniref:S8 family serine peptidase n=1 Tax=Clostridium nigeriense TaxID=1805470 RepID=UPI003D34A67E
MIYIENLSSSKINSTLGLIQNMPKGLLSKLGVNFAINNQVGNIIEVTIISADTPENVRRLVESLDGKYEDLGYGFGIVTISVENIVNLANSSSIQYIELPKQLFTTDSISNRAACVNTARDTYGIQGEGVLVGFIDTGIDYTHPAFRNEDGTTRIDYIYDLSTGGNIYNRDDIDNALKNSDPYSIVPSYDTVEHGTHVVGIACAGGPINPKYYGVAPKSSIAMVKSTRGNFALSSNIMKGLKFLIDAGKELNKPLVVNISMSTNDGAHNGTSLLEQYISTISTLERITIVIAAGNEGDAAHHIGGNLERENRIAINVAGDEAGILFNLYKPVLSDISIRIKSPTAVISGEVVVREGYYEGIIGLDRYQIYYSGPKPFDIIGEITIAILTNRQYISSGQWEITINLLNNYSGVYDMWLPISEGLNVNTKFLQPTVLNTLGIPATVTNIIAVGSYNYLTNTISSFSGRGRKTIYQPIRPDLVAPGEKIMSTIPNRSFDSKSGTSMATPHVAGIAALMMEWGILRRNDPYLFGERLKYYLVVSAKRSRTDITYPDPSWGYGEVCLYSAIGKIIENIGVTMRSRKGEYEMIKDFKSYNTLRNEFQPYKINSRKPNFDNFISRARQDTNGEVVGFFVEYNSLDDLKKINDIPGASVVVIDNNYAVVYIPFNRVSEIEPYIKDIASIEVPAIYTLEQISPVEASGATLFHNNPLLQLNGRGVVVGIIDTGIDYLNKEFMNEDDTTRILRIWDQNLKDSQDIYGMRFGVEYKAEDINRAIQASKSGGDPYSVVNSKDDIGHGTSVASLVGARGYNPDVIGAAPNCDFAIVKLKEAPEIVQKQAGVSTMGVGRYTSVEVILGIIYLSRLASDIKRPMVICIPLGTNIGAHDGTNEVETSIDTVSNQVGVVCVTGTGNEGDTDTHTEGRFEKAGEIRNIEIRIGKGQKDLNFQIYVQEPDRVSLGIVSPSGEVVEKIPAKLNRVENVGFIYEGTKMRISYLYPDPVTGLEVISIEARGLREGIWQFRLYGDYIVDGRYWSWLPQRSLLDADTKFLSPSPYITLTMPGTSKRAVVAAFYDQNNNATVGQSGRGFTRDGRIKPDLAAGGINAMVTTPGGGTKTISGSSVATAVTAGCCALLFQWGIIDGNDANLYATEVRSYFIRGTTMRAGDIYPNEQWGYGILNIKGVFDALRENLLGGVEKTRGYDEYSVGGLFIRRPKDL